MSLIDSFVAKGLLIGSSTSLTHPGALIAQIRDPGTINVCDPPYNAKGDGVTDDTAAIQAAIDACPIGGTVFIPSAGSNYYKLTNALTITRSMTLRGDHGGYGGNIALVQTNPANSCIVVFPTLPSQKVVFERLTLDAGIYGIDWNCANHAVPNYVDRASSMKDIYCLNQSSAGINVSLMMIGCRHENIHLEGCGDYGLRAIDVIDAVGATRWSGMRVSGTNQAGIYIVEPGIDPVTTQQTAITFANLVCEGNNRIGLRTRSCFVVLENPHFESNGIAGNGSSTLYPDILCDSGYTALSGNGSSNQLTFIGGYFSPSHANQNNLRIKWANCVQRMVFVGTRFQAVDTIDCDGFISSSTIHLLGVIPQPTIANFADPFISVTTNLLHQSYTQVSTTRRGGLALGSPGTAPSTGAYTTGDIVVNTDAATPGDVGAFRCTSGGTPGTWVPEYKLPSP